MSVVQTSKLQVPMPKDLRDSWEEHAKNYGFDSLQAYVRFLAKADVDGRKVNFNEGVTLSPEAAARYDQAVREHEELRKHGKVKSYTGTSEMMKDLLADD